MDTPRILRQDATCKILYCVQMVKDCRYKEHQSCVGPNTKQWSDDLEESIKHFVLWFHEAGYLPYYNDTLADCCSFEIQIERKRNDGD
jgi:hypothetical protein